MKKRLIITIVAGVLDSIGGFFSASSIMFLTLLSCPPSSFLLAPLTLLGLFAVTIWNIVGVFTQWHTHRFRALVPLAVCVLFFWLGGFAHDLGLDLRIREFRGNLPKYEEKVASVVDELKKGAGTEGASPKSNHYGQFPDGKTVFNVYAGLDTNGVATVRFVRVISLNLHHRGYMYRADGNFKSALREREWIQAPVNTNWCAISD